MSTRSLTQQKEKLETNILGYGDEIETCAMLYAYLHLTEQYKQSETN